MEYPPLPDRYDQLPVPPAIGPDASWALFLDVDGTLLDFAASPAAVVVEAQLRADLARLRANLHGAVALLSGRQLAQLDDMFDWRGCAAAGLHGAELRAPDGREYVVGDGAAFASIRKRALALVANTRGVLLEDKRRALALHFRRTPAAMAAAKTIAESLLLEAGDNYSLLHGDHVIELKPASVDKGRALETLMRDAPFHGRCPWMFGDDLTDEDAFECVNACDGVSVIVGARRPSQARFALPNPAAVRGWLRALTLRSRVEHPAE